MTYKGRELLIATYYVENGGTVRQVAKKIGLSKTTVHKELVNFILAPHNDEYEKELANKVKNLLNRNNKEKHIRGGLSTRQKYLQIRASKKDMK